jgi:hypothetical protein
VPCRCTAPETADSELRQRAVHGKPPWNRLGLEQGRLKCGGSARRIASRRLSSRAKTPVAEGESSTSFRVGASPLAEGQHIDEAVRRAQHFELFKGVYRLRVSGLPVFKSLYSIVNLAKKVPDVAGSLSKSC